MTATSVTSKGQITIPKELRQRLGITKGSRIEFALMGEHVEMRLLSSTAVATASGFGMLKSRRASVPAGLDPASLVSKR